MLIIATPLEHELQKALLLYQRLTGRLSLPGLPAFTDTKIIVTAKPLGGRGQISRTGYVGKGSSCEFSFMSS
jgi:hypothetical protein